MKSKPVIKGLFFFLGGGIASLLFLGLVAYLSNLNIPEVTGVTEYIDSVDKVRLAETIHLKDELGELVWPGWGQMDIPVLIWHSKNSFLFGIDQSPPRWEVVSSDQFQGKVYYSNSAIDPENFAMHIGGQWVASMATKKETDLFIENVFREVIPDSLEPFFPYRLLVLNSEIQMSGVLHETFHVYQVMQAPEKFNRTEASFSNSDTYWQVDGDMGDAWQKEMNLLVEAVESDTIGATQAVSREFLAAREQRRGAYRLTTDQISFEREVEWLEGLAKYVELGIWEIASKTPNYHPIPDMNADPDFKNYSTFKRHWNQEMSQAQRQATKQGDVRFYYSGMLQARLLDRLVPDWKTRVMEEGIYLEDLLKEAVLPEG